MIRRLHFLSLGLACLLSLGACGAVSQPTRARTGFQAYLSALRGDNPKTVYDMLTREQQAATSYDEWSKQWRESAPERKLQAEQLEAGLRTHGSLDERARLRFADGKLITLHRSETGWQLDQALVTRNRADSPEDALHIFATALRDRDVETILQILSTRHREAIESKIVDFQASLDAQLESSEHEVYVFNPEEPERAAMTWSSEGVRYKIVLVRENGDWHLDDIHLGPDPVPSDEKKDESKASESGVLDLPRRR